MGAARGCDGYCAGARWVQCAGVMGTAPGVRWVRCGRAIRTVQGVQGVRCGGTQLVQCVPTRSVSLSRSCRTTVPVDCTTASSHRYGGYGGIRCEGCNGTQSTTGTVVLHEGPAGK